MNAILKPAPIKLRNSRGQDLMLLAKDHYRQATVSTTEAARLIVAAHNLYDLKRLSWADAAYCVVSDMEHAGLLDRITKREGGLVEFLTNDLAPRDAGSILGPDYSQPGGYHAVLIHATLTHALLTQCFEDGRWLLQIPEATPDPQIEVMLKNGGAW